MKKLLLLLVAMFVVNACGSSNTGVEKEAKEEAKAEVANAKEETIKKVEEKVVDAVEAIKTDGIMGKSWVLTHLKGDTVVVDTIKARTPFFMLRTADKITGNNGCNIFNGSYTMAGDTLKIGGLMTTMMACPNVTYEDNYLAFFKESLVITSQKGDELSLKNTVTNIEAKFKQIDVEN